jgi:glycosidase
MNLRHAVFIVALLMASFCQGQSGIAVTPTISPAFFTQNDQITVTYNVTGTALAALTDAYIWVWIPGANIDSKYNINPASTNTALTNVIGPNGPKFTKAVESGQTLFTITFTPSNFFTGSISSASSMGMLLKGNNWTDGQTADYIASFGFQIQLTSPSQLPVFVDNGDAVTINATTSIAANFELFINNISVDTENAVTSYSYSHTVTETTGFGEVKLVATAGVNSDEIEFQYIISANSPTVSRPAGIIPGINYDANDDTKVTLCLWAPLKSSVYVVGDFDDAWIPKAENIMNRDGEFFWIELTGLTVGQEYAYQYLVDEHIWVADPYADKILDPEDQSIPEATYPDLKPFPSEALRSDWYENRVAVFQTAQTSYEWQVTDFEKPAKEGLVIYELLIRDFFDDQHRNYQSLIDTISYFKRLGINAIELMPVMEFNGNEGWGYNPTFMFAPDKYYGTKNKLKEFVDVCHQNGIAVILDIAMNHQDVPNTYASMYFDFNGFVPTADNPWFNVTAKHPFNVFFDMNHESAYTKAYLDTVNYYWLNEFKVDGFRFDLSKGFTQTYNTDVGLWSNYDQSRINILTRMADKIWSHVSDAYVILEHLGVNAEEKVLADYRSNEGKGMMLWGKMTDQYNQNTMGYSSNADIGGVSHKSRNWNKPRLVGYMESHDEERLMFKNLQYGSTTDSYNVKNESTALLRMQAAGLVFYTIPGPKMIWEFGELGFDYSINTCSDGSINPPGSTGGNGDCRLSEKPLPWDDQFDYFKNRLFEHTGDLLRLRKEYDVFTSGDALISGGSTLSKQITIKNNPYTATPVDATEMNVQIAVNFDVVAKSIDINFPHTGVWYDYYDHGTELDVALTPFTIELYPGEYRLFTDIEINNPIVITDVPEKAVSLLVSLYPNPVQRAFKIKCEENILDLTMQSLQGQPIYPVRLSNDTWDVSGLANGLYIAEVVTNRGKQKIKIIKSNN